MFRLEVIYTDEFGEWFDALEESEQDAGIVVARMRGQMGVTLGFPASSALRGSRYALRELRPKQGRSPLRVIYAFDPRRDAVLIIGGDKGSSAKFYDRIIRTAEAIWEAYLAAMTAQKKAGEKKK